MLISILSIVSYGILFFFFVCLFFFSLGFIHHNSWQLRNTRGNGNAIGKRCICVVFDSLCFSPKSIQCFLVFIFLDLSTQTRFSIAQRYLLLMIQLSNGNSHVKQKAWPRFGYLHCSHATPVSKHRCVTTQITVLTTTNYYSAWKSCRCTIKFFLTKL